MDLLHLWHNRGIDRATHDSEGEFVLRAIPFLEEVLLKAHLTIQNINLTISLFNSATAKSLIFKLLIKPRPPTIFAFNRFLI